MSNGASHTGSAVRTLWDAPTWLVSCWKLIRFWILTNIALALCVWVGFELSLIMAGSAAITVGILADPNTGAVFSKSKWRLLGTLAGGAIIAILSVWCAQAPWLFFTVLALWTAACSYLAAHFRYFKAYASALAGYTATIILIEINQDFSLTMFTAVQRVGEIILAVLSVALVFGIGHVRQGVRRLEPAMHSQGRHTFELAQNILVNPTRRNAVEQIRAWVVQTEQLQHDLFLFGEEESVFAKQARSIRVALADLYGPLTCFCDALLALAQVSKTEASIKAREQALHCLRILDTLGNTAQSVQLVLDQELPKLLEPIQQTADNVSHPDLRIRILHLPKAMEDLLLALLNYRRIRHDPLAMPVRQLGKLVENPVAIFQALGVGVGYLAFCIFWVETGWKDGDLALLNFVAASMLQMANDQPVAGMLAMLKGLVIAVLVTLPLKFLLLPMSEGLGWLLFCGSLGILPGCILKFRPETASIGSGYLMFFILLLGYSATPSYDIQGFMNSAVSMAVSTVAGVILMAATHPWRAESRLRMMLGQARQDFLRTRQQLLALKDDKASSQIFRQTLGQWEDRQFLRLLQLKHVIMLSSPRPADAVARILIRLTRKMRTTIDAPHIL